MTEAAADGPAPVEHVSLPAGDLTLAVPEPRHAAEALATMTDPDVQRWNPAPKVVDLDSAREWLERSRDWGAAWASWSILDSDGRYLGTSVLWNMDRAEHFSGSVGYRIGPWARRRGVASAAVQAMAGFGFTTLGLARIDLVHTVANVGSCGVAQRVGFALEGTMRSEYRTFDGQRWDSHLHARLASDG
jgi:RimJ/RimL family protein N-acetyltransferase